MTGRPFVYVVGQLRLGGLERQLYYLLEQLIRREYRLVVVVWNYRDEDAYATQIKSLGVDVIGLDPTASRFRKLRALRRIIFSLRPEVVHSYSFFTNFAVWFACFGLRTLAVGSLRSDFVSEKLLAGPLLGRLSGRWPRAHIANNNVAAKAARRAGIWAPRVVQVVRNGLDLQNFCPTGEWPTVPTAIGVGSLFPDKRWDRLLYAAGQLFNEGLVFKIRLAGEGPDRSRLEGICEEWRICAAVEFLGARGDVPALLNQSSFLVLASKFEGCPNVVMEALACARPVLATDAGDVPELVVNGQTGFVVRRGDDQAFVERLRTLVLNPALCQSMGSAARARAEQDFGLDRLMKQTLAAYEVLRTHALTK